MTQATRSAVLKFALLTGAADSATAGITCTAGDGTAITTSDIIVGCLELAVTTNVWTDRTASAAIIAGGKITVDNSENDKVAVWWLARNAAGQVDSPFIGTGIATGALANTSMTLTGIALTDTLISVIEVNASSGAWTDRTAATSIYAANTIRCTQSTNGNIVYVLYMDNSGPRGFSALNLQMGIATVDSSPTTDPSSATLTSIHAKDVIFSAVCVDETNYNVLYDLTAYCTAGTHLITVDEPSPTATAGAKILVFFQKSNDLE